MTIRSINLGTQVSNKKELFKAIRNVFSTLGTMPLIKRFYIIVGRVSGYLLESSYKRAL